MVPDERGKQMQVTKQDFDVAWSDVANCGGCDGHGGAEYERVSKQLLGTEVVGALHLRCLIYRLANTVPHPTPPTLWQRARRAFATAPLRWYLHKASAVMGGAAIVMACGAFYVVSWVVLWVVNHLPGVQ